MIGETVTAVGPPQNGSFAVGQSVVFGLQGTVTGTAAPPEVPCGLLRLHGR